MSQTVQWLSYPFYVCEHESPWLDRGGIYIFTGLNRRNQWVAMYIGQTDSLSTRIPSHEKWGPAARLGATHVHAMVVKQAIQRAAIEAELIRAFQPRLNQQQKGLWA